MLWPSSQILDKDRSDTVTNTISYCGTKSTMAIKSVMILAYDHVRQDLATSVGYALAMLTNIRLG